MYSNLGRHYFADYLNEQKGLNTASSLGFFDQSVKKILSHFHSYQAHITARTHIKNVMDMADQTRTGREIIEFAAKTTTSMALEPTFEYSYANLRGKPSILRVSSKDPKDIQANLLTHELRHEQQTYHETIRFGDPHALDRRAFAFADTAYPMIIAEADAFATQTIQAYELHLKGIRGPWAWHRFTYTKKPLAQALTDSLGQGNNLYATETKRAIFHAWMTHSLSRVSYETEYLRDIVTKPYLANRLHEAGLSHSNDDLQTYTTDSLGHSYMKDADLTTSDYLRVWGTLRSKNDILSAAIESSKVAYFLSSYIPALEMIDLLEDHLNGNDKWADLPHGYDAFSFLEKEKLEMFGKVISHLSKIRDVYSSDPMLKHGVNELLDRALVLTDKHTLLKDAGWGNAISEARGSKEEQKPKKLPIPRGQYCLG